MHIYLRIKASLLIAVVLVANVTDGAEPKDPSEAVQVTSPLALAGMMKSGTPMISGGSTKATGSWMDDERFSIDNLKRVGGIARALGVEYDPSHSHEDPPDPPALPPVQRDDMVWSFFKVLSCSESVLIWPRIVFLAILSLSTSMFIVFFFTTVLEVFPSTKGVVFMTAGALGMLAILIASIMIVRVRNAACPADGVPSYFRHAYYSQPVVYKWIPVTAMVFLTLCASVCSLTAFLI